MRPSARRADDADVIRARLRALLDDRQRRGWVPDDDPDGWPDDTLAAVGAGADEDGDDLEVDEGAADPIPRADRGDAGRRTAGSATGQDIGMPGGLGRHRVPGPAARLDPGRPGARALWVAGLVAALVLVGWTWLDRPQVEPAPAPPSGSAVQEETPRPATPSVGEVAETSATLVVAVVGLVARPGLVTLPAGARVADAVAAAGGLLPDADPASVNLAAPVADGQQIAVGVPGAAPVGGSTGPGGGVAPAVVPGGTLDLNTATAAELDALPGLGPVLAQRVVDHRTQHGRFRSVGQLEDVPGIGPAVAGGLADLLRV